MAIVLDNLSLSFEVLFCEVPVCVPVLEAVQLDSFCGGLLLEQLVAPLVAG